MTNKISPYDAVTIDDILEDSDWKEFPNPLNNKARSIQKFFTSAYGCQCNREDGVHINLYHSKFEIVSRTVDNYELELMALSDDGNWVKLAIDSIELYRLDELCNRLVTTWEAYNYQYGISGDIEI